MKKTVLGLDSLSHLVKIYQPIPINYLIGGFRSEEGLNAMLITGPPEVVQHCVSVLCISAI